MAKTVRKTSGRKPHKTKAAASKAKTEIDASPWVEVDQDEHHHRARAWLVNYLSKKYHVRPSKVDMEHSIHDWGLDSPGLASLAGSFNRDAADNPLWKNLDVAPPDLISRVKDGKLDDLVSVLGARAADAATAVVSAPREPVIETFLFEKFGLTRPGLKPTAVFGSRALTVSPDEVDSIATDFCEEHHVQIGPLLANAVSKRPGLTIGQAANSLYNSLGHQGAMAC